MNKELEEAAYNACNKEGLSWENDYAKEKFIQGAKSDAARDYWFEKFQQKQDKKMYSEEEVLDLLYKRDLYLLNRDEEIELELPEEWFKNLNNK
jgi:hypothetical protein